MHNVIGRVRAAVTGADAERFAKRKEIKRELAGLEAVAGRHRAIGDQLRTLGQREDAAVSAHQKTCEPLQKKLADIETKITNAILADEPVSDRLAQQRADALEGLAAANSKLEAEINVLKTLRGQLEEQRRRLDNEVSRIEPVRGKLMARGIANPELLLQRFTNGEEVRWAERRLGAAEEELRRAQNALRVQERVWESATVTNSYGDVIRRPMEGEAENARHGQKLREEVAQWEAEVSAAEEARYAAIERKAAIREQILGE